MNEYGFSCPTCGSADVRRSRRQGFAEIPKMLLGVYPFRCLACGERFFGNVWLLSTRGYANCPKCLRLSVLPWAKRESHLSGADKVRLALGAHTYRCVPCRYTFLSFRKGIAPSGYAGSDTDSGAADGRLEAAPARHPGVPGNEPG